MLKLADLTLDYLNELYEWEMDSELQWKVGMEQARTFEQLQKSYNAYLAGEKPRLILKGIWVDNVLVGKIELFKNQEEGYIGIVIGRESQRGHGIGAQAFKQFTKEVLIPEKVKKVVAEVYDDNNDSVVFFQKIGFVMQEEVKTEMFRGKERHLHILTKRI